MKNAQQIKLNKKALLLSFITVGYNALEGIVSIVAGVLAGSIALVGFGSDSFVESFSGGLMIWRFSRCEDRSEEEEERVEKTATRFISYSFFVLAAYIVFESIKKLVSAEIPQTSLLGIIVAILSIIFMPVLYFNKIKTAKALNSKSLVADAKETLACMFLSMALLLGLGLNYLFGIWQADPIVGLFIAAYLVKEAVEILTEKDECETSG